MKLFDKAKGMLGLGDKNAKSAEAGTRKKSGADSKNAKASGKAGRKPTAAAKEKAGPKTG